MPFDIPLKYSTYKRQLYNVILKLQTYFITMSY